MRRTPRRDEERGERGLAAPPPPARHVGLVAEEIASAIGNRAFASLVQEELRISAGPHPRLHPGTPAWTEEGRMVLGPPALQLSAEERADVIRHETVHVLQQRLAPADESGHARANAEQLAERSSGDPPAIEELRAPAPRLLAAPIRGKPATGFDRLFGGHGEVIGEVVDSGVAVRISQTYANLGIEPPVDPKSQFGAATMSELQYLSCNNRAFPALQAIANKLRSVAQAVARVNGAIAAGSPWRVEQVFVVNEASRLHFADGRALITIALQDFESSAVQTAAHEAAHAVFESHSHPDATKPDVLAPDTLALRISDLFLRLASTRPVPIPAESFKKRKPPLKARDDDMAQRPAGLVMVTDGLWSAGAATDGHPWDGPDEFFASAYGAFQTDERVLSELIAHYAAADAAITPAGAELLTLLRAVKDPKAQQALGGLAAGERDAATEAIRAREAQASTIKLRLGAILDPANLPPAAITCPGK